MKHTVRVGLVGIGQRGLQHLDALWKIPAAQVTALCDPFADNLAEDKIKKYVDGFCLDGIDTFARFADLLVADVDAIYFCIPPGRHQGEVIAAAERGKHVFVEKPVSLFLDEAIEMHRAIDRAGVLATVGFQQRHDHWHSTMKDFLATKRLVMMTVVTNGSLESHSVKHTHTGEIGGPQNRVWAANLAWSGSTVVEAGIHPLDLMRYWAGDVAWTEARYMHRDPDDIEDGGDNPNGYSVTFGFDSGAIANLILTRLRKTFWGDSYQDIVWDRGHLKIEAEGPVAYYYDGPYPPADRIDPAALRHPLATGARNDSNLAINQAFVDAVCRGSKEPLLNTFSSSMNSLAAVLAANVSDQLDGRRVVLDELLESEEYAPFRKKPQKE